MLKFNLEYIVGSGHVDRPAELIALGFVVNLFYGNTVFFTPATNIMNKHK